MEQLWQVQYSFLIPLLPLLGAAIAGFFGARWLKEKSHWPIWLGVGASAVISITLLMSMLMLWKPAEQVDHPKIANYTITAPETGQPLATNKVFYHWITAGSFNADAAFWIDPLTVVMLCVVTGIGFFITVFAAG